MSPLLVTRRVRLYWWHSSPHKGFITHFKTPTILAVFIGRLEFQWRY